MAEAFANHFRKIGRDLVDQISDGTHNHRKLTVGVALRATPTPSWWGASRPPKPPRARKSLRAILVTRHCSCVPVSHL